jgi:large subunit ribosomal protein L13
LSSEQVQAVEPQGPHTIYVDASGQIAGRLSSKIAAELLHGKNRVVVLNAEKAVVSGKRDTVFRLWKERLEIYSHVNPIYGPIHPRKPDNILHRMVRGMIPKTKSRGTDAMGRLRVYIGVPEKFNSVKTIQFDDAQTPRPLPLYVTLAEISKNIGWSG